MTSPEAFPRMSPEEYLAYEQEQPIRHELVDGYLYAMTGATDRHEEIALNFAAMLRSQLRGSPCRVYKGDLKIRVTDDFYYPDVFVRCGGERGNPYFKTDPAVIAEILYSGNPALRSWTQTVGVFQPAYVARVRPHRTGSDAG